jgi:Tetratricopeptide repeat
MTTKETLPLPASTYQLGNSYQAAGRTGEAIAILEQVAADRERLLGPDHPDTRTAQINLAIMKTEK